MGATLSDTPADRHDTLSARVTEMADRCRASGKIGDLFRLRDLRLAAGAEITEHTATSWAKGADEPVIADLFPEAGGTIPEVDVRDLSIDRLRSAMHHHGALIVRNLFASRLAFEFQGEIDNVLGAAREAHRIAKGNASGDRSIHSKAFFLPPEEEAGEDRLASHWFMAKTGAIETFLSPRVSHRLLDTFERLGLRGLLQAYFRDEPCVSFRKSVLRRTEPQDRRPEWHQDGAFMTENIQSLNLWVALSDCGDGTESPGMELLPKRLTSILPTGTNGAIFDWSVSGASVAEAYPDTPPARPFFGAGDGIFFDHYNLHATSTGALYSQPRYAIETWFFAKSRSALNQIPVYW
ncbi:MAG: hypothetical protein AAGE18_07325 [Pseudomonadota bacterium]